MYLLAISSDVRLFKSEEEHDHGEQIKQGLPKEIKSAIDEILTKGVKKPKMVICELRRKNFDEHDLVQIRNYIKYKRSKTNPKIVYLGELSEFCEKNSKVPGDPDIPYVVGKLIDFDQKTFRFFVSTPRLMSLLNFSESLQADATYKLLWEGFPVLVVGTSDKNRHFHPFGMAVCSSEAQEDFQTIFNILKSESTVPYRPKYIIADCAEAITNAFSEVFGPNFTRVYCWFHIMKNIKHKLHSISDIDIRSEIKSDISFLQLSDSPEEFARAKDLWITKWSSEKEASQFVEYFKTQYLDQRSGWFQGIAPGHPLTNNGLEAINSWIKKEGTLRERLPLRDFIECTFRIISNWSCDRSPISPNYKSFALYPDYPTSLISKSYEFAKTRASTIKQRRLNNEQINCFIPATGKAGLRIDDIEKYLQSCKNLSWKRFDTYKKCKNRLWLLTFHEDNWIDSVCNCPIFKKEYICKHVMGIAISMNKFIVPDNAKNVELGTMRKRGRSAKATKALLF